MNTHMIGQIDAIVENAPAVHDRAVALDAKIIADTKKISPKYVDLVCLATRQVLGSLDITVVSDAKGGVNVPDFKIFIKNMGVDQCVPLIALFRACLTFLSCLAGASIRWRGCTLRGPRFST